MRYDSHSRSMTVVTALILGGKLLAACSSDARDEQVGEVQLAIATVPNDVNCIRVTGESKERKVARLLDLLPGSASVVKNLSGVPLGSVTFAAEAFSQQCSAVDSNATPGWISDPVQTTVVLGLVGEVRLSMHRNGREDVVIDFPAEGQEAACTSDGGKCSTSAECCSQSCIAGLCAVAGCHAANDTCKIDKDCCAGLTCQQGVCQAPVLTCMPDGLPCGGPLACCSGAACTFGFCPPHPVTTCVPPGLSCDANHGCCLGLDCQGGTCQPPTPVCAGGGLSCDAGHGCCPGFECIGSTCRAAVPGCQPPGLGCDANHGCCPGSECSGGTCRPISPVCGLPTHSCHASSDCCAPLECRAGSCQVPLVCLPTFMPGCLQDGMCCSSHCVTSVLGSFCAL